MVDQKPQYLTTKWSVFSYTRRIPQSLQVRFQSYRFVKCLHTKSQAAVVNLTIQEQGLGCASGFSKIYLPDEEAETRQPIPTDELIIILNKCLEIADERRLLIVLI